jgi:SNF2 family DNA or RNA helicase
MHVLHGTWLPITKRFALWGEDTAVMPKPRRGKRKKPAEHPFALSIEQWLRYLDRFSTESEPDGDTITILLPGVGANVQPSPEAQASGVPPPDGDIQLLPWILDAIILKPTDALDLLLQLPMPEEQRAGFTLGSDLFFWQQASLLVMNCLVEQRYIPALEQQGSRYVAHWRPQPDPALVARLLSGMPPICRAVLEAEASAPSPESLLEDFLKTTLDAFIREVYQPKRPLAHPWLKALAQKSAVLSGLPRDNAKLYDAWQAWQEAAAGGIVGGAFRVCFRLEEPAMGEEEWSLRYMLQATDDPSLLIDAAAVWSATGHTLHYLERRFDQPQEKLLAALGLASRLFKPIERSLREASPVGVWLSADEAYSFLVEATPLLEQNHFGVLVPNWWARGASNLRAKATLKDPKEPSGLLGMNTLIKYEWELSVGEQRISRREFEELVGLKQPLVRFRGEWIALDPAHVNAALKFFDRQTPDGEVTLLDALKLTVPDSGVEADGGLQVETVEVEGGLAQLLERLRNPDQSEAPPVPETLHGTLRPYQERGFGWLVQMRRLGLGACLADDMGLGKSVQTITIWLHEREPGRIDSPALLVCPTSVVGNWRHEINRFAPSLRVYTHQGPDRLRGDKFTRAMANVDVVLTSYALLSRDLDTLKRISWSDVVLDEAQNIKNSVTKQAQAARALKADYRLALTGTPVENRLTELWSILHFLNPGYLGSREVFRSQFAIPIERYDDGKTAAKLRRLTAPFVLRRVKTDPKVIDDLPEKLENKVFCTLTPEQATLYEAVVREELEAIENAESAMERRGSVLRMLTRLKQICNHPAHFLKEGTALGVEALQDRSGKLTRLTEMLEEVYSVEDRALIFTQYAEMGKHLQAYLREMFTDEVLFLYGDTPAKEREEMVRRFQAPRGPALFILSLKAGGTGLNLTHANHVFHFDRWYNPAVENQATDRAFRIGQTRNVQVHKFVCLGTLEERIDELIEHKKGLADRIVGEGEGWISEMSTDELRDLVTLRQEMVQEAE